jgi:hypothetical protein
MSFHSWPQVEEQVDADIAEEVQHDVAEGEQADGSPEADQPRLLQDPRHRRDGQADQQQP